jgi:hypothetical protein
MEGICVMFSQLVSTFTGKVLLGLWVLILLTIVGFPLWGLLQDDFLGYLLFSLMISFIPADLAILVSYVVKGAGYKVTKGIWIALALAHLAFVLCLANSLIGHEGADDSGIAIGMSLFFPMLICSFPISWAIIFSIASTANTNLADVLNKYLLALGHGLSHDLDAGANIGYSIGLFLAWLTFVVGGYIQWFKLIPFLINRFTKDSNTKESGDSHSHA